MVFVTKPKPTDLWVGQAVVAMHKMLSIIVEVVVGQQRVSGNVGNISWQCMELSPRVWCVMKAPGL